MNDTTVIRTDERTDAVIGMSARLVTLVFSFGLLAIALVRMLAFGQACWDLLALYVVGNVMGLGYQYAHRASVIPWRWIALFALGGAAFALTLGLLRGVML